MRLVLIIAVFCITYGCYRFFNPYDKVTTNIQGLPVNADFVCMVADTDDGLKAMEWSLAKVLPFSMHPDRSTVSSLVHGKTSHHANVRWIFSKRVGVLHRTADRAWTVSWFDPPASQPEGRSFLFGGGSVTMDLSNTNNQQQMSTEQLRSLGMEHALKPK